ncbi:MAG: hypothetical protein QOI61_248, partial [Actinomycetota bacterium]
MSEFDRRIARIAGRQHQLIRLADVTASGGTRHHAMRRVEAGRWEWIFDRVYR